jgi:hypothetical protein
MCSRHSPPIGRHSVSPCLFLANRYEFITALKSEGGQAEKGHCQAVLPVVKNPKIIGRR